MLLFLHSGKSEQMQVSQAQRNVMTQGRDWFATTHWSVVESARNGDSEQSHTALEQLCAGYWYPLYAYVRRKGYRPHDAQDLTQEFFHRLLQGNFLATIEQRKGKFRTFLLASLEHFLAKEWARANRQKRGGGAPLLSLDDQHAENRYLEEPADPAHPQRLYERRWVMILLQRTLDRLQEECRKEGQGDLFEQAKGLLSGDGEERPYSELAESVGRSEGAFKVAVYRLRKRYGKLLRAEIAETVGSPKEVEEEIRFLFSVLRP